MTSLHWLPLVCLLAAGQAETSTEPDKTALKAWVDFYTGQAAEFQMFVGGERQKLDFYSQPVFQYTNPVRPNKQHGAIYVWTHFGRPEVIGSIWSAVPQRMPDRRTVSQELQSLSTEPVSSQHPPRIGIRGPVLDWSVSEPGIELVPLPGAPPPPASSALHLVQMRRLAERFAASTVERKSEAAQPLRLLRQPLFRYQSAEAGVADGALFAFVLATDPELILVLESREAAGEPRWHYAVARMTDAALSLRLGDQEVWSCPPGRGYLATKPYYVYWGASTYPLDFEPGK